MPKPSFDEQIRVIMEQFDFGAVVDGMRYLGLTWGSGLTKGNDGIPTVAEVKECACYLLADVATGAPFASYCGRLCARQRNGWMELFWMPVRAEAEDYFWQDDPPA